MTVEETRFISEMLRAIRSDVGDVKSRMTSMALRQTSMVHRLLGIDTHLAAFQHDVTALGNDMRRVKQRLELVEE